MLTQFCNIRSGIDEIESVYKFSFHNFGEACEKWVWILFHVLELRVFWKVHNVSRDRVVSVGYDVNFPFHIEPNLMVWSQTFPNPTSITNSFLK